MVYRGLLHLSQNGPPRAFTECETKLCLIGYLICAWLIRH